MEGDGRSPMVEPRVLSGDDADVRDIRFLKLRVKRDVEIPLSRILGIVAVGVVLFTLGWFSASYRAELSQPGAVPRIEPYTAEQRQIALELTRIAFETGGAPIDVFNVYQAQVSQARTFDQQYSEEWQAFSSAWRDGTLNSEGSD